MKATAVGRGAVLSGCMLICGGGLFAFTSVGAVMLGMGAVLVLSGSVTWAVAARSPRSACIGLAVGVGLFFLFPLAVNVMFWAGNDFQGQDDSTIHVATLRARPR